MRILTYPQRYWSVDLTRRPEARPSWPFSAHSTVTISFRPSRRCVTVGAESFRSESTAPLCVADAGLDGPHQQVRGLPVRQCDARDGAALLQILLDGVVGSTEGQDARSLVALDRVGLGPRAAKLRPGLVGECLARCDKDRHRAYDDRLNDLTVLPAMRGIGMGLIGVVCFHVLWTPGAAAAASRN